MAVSKRTRYEVLRRDNHSCRYCGGVAPDVKLVVDRPSDWEPTIWQFYGLGLPITELEDAVKIAAGNQMVDADRVFRYMCGVLWNKVNAMQEGAKSILEVGQSDG